MDTDCLLNLFCEKHGKHDPKKIQEEYKDSVKLAAAKIAKELSTVFCHASNSSQDMAQKPEEDRVFESF
jgi:hypothetical protein